MTEEEINKKAEELAERNVKLILEARQEAVDKAIVLGYTPEDYYFEDNLSDVVDNPAIPYKITLKLKPRLPERGQIKDE